MEWRPLYNSTSHVINNIGEIYSVDREYIDSMGRLMNISAKPIAIRKTFDGEYYFCTPSLRFKKRDDVEFKTVYIHKAVADHFIPKPLHIRKYEKQGGAVYASYIIKDCENNSVSNIRWITQLELIQSQPKRLADPTKMWRTRREKYGNKAGAPVKKKVETLNSNQDG